MGSEMCIRDRCKCTLAPVDIVVLDPQLLVCRERDGEVVESGDSIKGPGKSGCWFLSLWEP